VVQTALESFCDELITRAPNDIVPILLGHKNQVGKQDLHQDPEQFVNQYLVWPICDAVGLDYISEWYHEGHGGSLDLYIRNTTHPVFGECKRLNHYKLALGDLKEYLGHRTAKTNFGLATDGLTWLLVKQPVNTRKNPKILEYHSFRGALFEYLIEAEAVSPQLQGKPVRWHSSVGKVADVPYRQYGKLHREPMDASIQTFENKFSPENLSAYTDGQGYDETLSSFDEHGAEEYTERTVDDFTGI